MIIFKTLEIAFDTPLPIYKFLSLSLNYKASYFPVEAPDGTAALNTPKEVYTST